MSLANRIKCLVFGPESIKGKSPRRKREDEFRRDEREQKFWAMPFEMRTMAGSLAGPNVLTAIDGVEGNEDWTMGLPEFIAPGGDLTVPPTNESPPVEPSSSVPSEPVASDLSLPADADATAQAIQQIIAPMPDADSSDEIDLPAATDSPPPTIDLGVSDDLLAQLAAATAATSQADPTSNPPVDALQTDSQTQSQTASDAESFADDAEDAGAYNAAQEQSGTSSETTGPTATDPPAASTSPTAFFTVDQANRKIFRYDREGDFISSSPLAQFNTRPRGIASDPPTRTLWVVDASHTIFVYDFDGNSLGSWLAPELLQPQDITTDGDDLWIVDVVLQRVFFFNDAASLLSGTQMADASFNLTADNNNPTGIVTDGTLLYISNDFEHQDKVFIYDFSGNLAGSWLLDPANDDPSGITVNPGSTPDLWTVDRQDDLVYHYANGKPQRSGSLTATDTFPLVNSNRHAEGIARGNQPPEARDDSYSVVHDRTLTVAVEDGVLINDFDADLDPLTAVLVTDAQRGQVFLNPDGSFSYEPDFQFVGTDSFTYVANDGSVDSNVATVTITVTNRKPFFTSFPVPRTFIELVDDSAPAPDGLVSWWQAEGNANDAVDSNHGTLVNGTSFDGGQVGQAFQFDGSDDFVEMGAPVNLRMTTAFTLDAWIHPTGTGSGGSEGGIILNKEGEYEIARFSDGTIRWAIANTSPGWDWINTGYLALLNQWTHIALTYDNGIIRSYVNGDLVHTFNGSGVIGDAHPGLDNFRIGGRQVASQFFAGLIDEVDVFDRALTDSEVQAIFNAGTGGKCLVADCQIEVEPYFYDAEATDPDGDPITFSLVSGPSGMTMDSDTGEVSWTPTFADLGGHAIALQVTDGIATADQHYGLTVSLSGVNTAPIFTSGPVVQAPPGLDYLYNVTARDPEEDALTFTLLEGPTGMSFSSSSSSSAVISWTPSFSDLGTHPVTVRVTDSHGLSTLQNYNVLVANPPPQFTSIPLTTAQANILYVYDSAATDPNDTDLTFALVEGPYNMTVNPVTGIVSWSPCNDDFDTSVNIVLSVTDPHGASDLQRYTLTVGAEPTNHAPLILSQPPDSFFLGEDNPVLTLFPDQLFDSGVNPVANATGDVDGDGDNDVITANQSGNSVSVFFNSTPVGAASIVFDNPVNYFVSAPNRIVLTDVNADDDLDILTTSAASNDVFLLTNDGNGIFSAPSSIFNVSGQTPLALSDFNGDTIPDLATGDGSIVSVWLGDGMGGFTIEQTYQIGYQPIAIAVADINNDTFLDVVTGKSESGILSTALGSASQPSPITSTNSVDGFPTGMALADLNADGYEELLVGFGASNSFGFQHRFASFRGVGDGTFTDQTNYADATTSIQVADIDADGDQDVVASTVVGSVSVYFGNGTTTLGRHIAYPLGQFPGALTLADLTGDGFVDMITELTSVNQLIALANDGLGKFGTLEYFLSAASPKSLKAGDFNEDGFLDVAFINPQEALTAALGNGDGTFSELHPIVPVQAGIPIIRTRDFEIADMNRDGHLDYIIAGFHVVPIFGTVPAVFALLGDGAGGFTKRTDLPVVFQSPGIAVGDLDGDESLDIVVSSAALNQSDPRGLVVFLGNCDGTFGAPSYYFDSGAQTLDELVVGDINGDGFDDVVHTNVFGGVSAWYSDSQGTLSSPQTFPLPEVISTAGCCFVFSHNIALVDLNHDNAPDVAAAGFGQSGSGNTVGILLNDGFGAFGNHASYNVGNGPVQLAVADLDGDDNLDIITVNTAVFLPGRNVSPQSISVILGIGDGSFSAKTDYYIGRGLLGLTTGDLDNDGDADVVTENTSLDSSYTGSGSDDSGFSDPTFATRLNSTIQISAGTFLYDVNARDQDGDTLTYSLIPHPVSSIQPPAGMTINPETGRILWDPTTQDLGTHTVTVLVIDSRGLTDTQTFELLVYDATTNQPPSITSTPPTEATEESPYTYTVTATDPEVDRLIFTLTNAPSGMIITQQSSAFSVQPSALISWTPSIGQAGDHTVTVRVTDPGDLFFDQTFTITVAARPPPPPDSPPIAAITSPELVEGSALAIIRDGLFDLMGTASDPDVGDTVSYEVSVAPFSDPFESFSVFSGQNAVVNDFLGTLDFTLLENGLYELTLSVTSVGALGSRTRTDTATFILDSQLKVGQFSFSQQDLVIPVSGIPLSVIRTYNSLLAHPFNASTLQPFNDFGPGWTYAITDLRFTLYESRVNVTDIEGSPFSLRDGGSRDITLTLPDGRKTTFAFSLTPGDEDECAPFDPQFCFVAKWTPPPGVYATLTPTSRNQLLTLPGLDPFWVDAGLGTPIDSYDFPSFVLTMKDGTRYVVERENLGEHFVESEPGVFIFVEAFGDGKLTQVIDRNGNRTEIGSDAINSFDASNVLTKSVLFERETLAGVNFGKIISILDPNQQASASSAPSVVYEYDSLTGNLIRVNKLQSAPSALSAVYATTEFVYGLAARPHFITEIRDPLGHGVMKSFFDDDGRLIATEDAFGNRVELDHNLANRVETVFDRLGNPTIYGYDTRGNVTSETNALGQTTQHEYDANDNETATTDALGNTSSATFDANGNQTSVTDPLGNTSSFSYDEFGNLLASVDPLGNSSTSIYDSNGNYISTTDALGNTNSFAYDSNGNLTSTTDALYRVTGTFGYDSSGNLTSSTDAVGVTNNFGYDDNNNQTGTSFVWMNPDDSQDTRTVTTQTIYNASGQVIETVDANGNHSFTVYNANGQVESSTDVLGNTTTYVYDTRGNVIEIRYPDGTLTRMVYDENGRTAISVDRVFVGQVTPPASVTFDRSNRPIYDTVGRVIRTERLTNVVIDILTDIDGTSRSSVTSVGDIISSSSSEYDVVGRVITSTDPVGSTTRYQYDAAGRQITVMDTQGNVTTTAYDNAGRQLSATDALAHTTSFIYDSLGRAVQTIFADSTSISAEYHELGQRVGATDQAGLTTNYEYDIQGQLTAVILPVVFDPETNTTIRPRYEYGYNQYGNNTSIEDPKHRITSFTYDQFGRQVTRTLPMGQTESQSYDNFGRLVSTTDFKGQITEYLYDSLGRLETRNYFEIGAATPSESITYTYDDLGRQDIVTQTLTSGVRVTDYDYDLDSRLIRVDAPEGIIEYGYDLATGRHIRTATEFTEILFGYDELSRLKTVSVIMLDGTVLPTPDVTTYQYDAVGNLARTELPNGVVTTYSYDDLNRLVLLTNLDPQSSIISSYEYVRGPPGNVLSVTENSGRHVAYTYDNLYRLTSETITGDPVGVNGTISYSYDLVGNRLTRNSSVPSVPSVVYEYNANDQLLSEANGSQVTTYSYDFNGSTVSKTIRDPQSSIIEQTAYTYNLHNQLVVADITDASGTHHIEYRYDDNGQRVTQIVDGIETRYLVDYNNPTGYPQVIEERDANGALIASYIYGFQLISQTRLDSSFIAHNSYFIFDGHSGVRHLTDDSGIVTDTYKYDAFGITLNTQGSTPNNFLYRGELFDSNTGFYNLGVRDMNPNTDRFTTMDSFAGILSEPQSLHKYLYANSDGVNKSDPSGKFTLLEILLVAIIIITLASLLLPAISGALRAAKGAAEFNKAIAELVSTDFGKDLWTTFNIMNDRYPPDKRWKFSVIAEKPENEIDFVSRRIFFPIGGLTPEISKNKKEAPSKLPRGVLLAHEIGHALDADPAYRFYFHYGETWVFYDEYVKEQICFAGKYWDPNHPRYPTAAREIIVSIDYENRFRDSAGIEARETYSFQPLPGYKGYAYPQCN